MQMHFHTSAGSLEDRIHGLVRALSQAGVPVAKFHGVKDEAGNFFDSEKAYGKGMKTFEQVFGFLQRKALAAGVPAGAHPASPKVSAPTTDADRIKTAFAAANAESDPYRRAFLFREASELLSAQRKN